MLNLPLSYRQTINEKFDELPAGCETIKRTANADSDANAHTKVRSDATSSPHCAALARHGKAAKGKAQRACISRQLVSAAQRSSELLLLHIHPKQGKRRMPLLRRLRVQLDCCGPMLPVRIVVDIHKPLPVAPMHACMNANLRLQFQQHGNGGETLRSGDWRKNV
jgi:hypothetical protein